MQFFTESLGSIAHPDRSPANLATAEFFQQSANTAFVSLRRFRTDAISCEQPLLGKVLLQNRFPYAVEFMSIWFRSGGLCRRASLLAFVWAMASLPTSLRASEIFSNTSLFYANTLTSEGTVRQDFDRFGGGFGSFEVNPQNGLELLSEAPNYYSAVRVFRLPLAASRSWQITVRARVQFLGGTTGQENPWYSTSVGLVKLGRSSDGSTSILQSAANRLSVALAKTDLHGNWGHYLQTSWYTNGQRVNTLGFDTGDLGAEGAVLIRLRYSADTKQLLAGYSVNNGGSFSDLWGLNLGTEWNVTANDELVIFLGGTSSPYKPDSGNNDFWSGFDKDNSVAPAPLPSYSVGSGEMYLNDFSVSYVSLAAADFTHEIINETEVTITGYTGSDVHVSVPQFIDGLPVTKIGSNAFSSKADLVSVVLPTSTTEIAAGSFANSPNLAAVYLPSNVHTIGDGAFSGSGSLRTVQLPSNLVLQAERFGLGGELAFQELVQRVGSSLADNELFMAALITNEKLLGLLTAKILSRYESYGVATQRDLGEFATKQDVQDGLEQSRIGGIQSVLDDPNSWSLYRADQVSGLSIGDLTLTRQENGSFVLNYDIEQSNDLETWTTYQNYGEELIGLPQDKKFLRIRVKQ